MTDLTDLTDRAVKANPDAFRPTKVERSCGHYTNDARPTAWTNEQWLHYVDNMNATKCPTCAIKALKLR